MGIVIPIRKPEETFGTDSIRIKRAGGEALVKSAPHQMVMLESEVRFKVTDYVAFELILYPQLPVQKVEPVAEELL
jgi:hypothetical protein